MISYLLESAFCLAAFYLVYHLALRRETFFRWNRAYLLLAPALSLVMPALTIELLPAEPGLLATNEALPVLVERVQTAPQAITETLRLPLWSITLGDILTAIYLGIAILLALRLVIQTTRLLRFIYKSKSCRRSSARSDESTPVASFFGFLLWQTRPPGNPARRLILEHELEHVRQWHSLDVLLIEALLVVQWFNPLLYLYRRRLREVHEFLADRAVVRRNGNRRAYAQLLVEQSLSPRAPVAALVTPFHSYLKPRLKMLAKQPSRPWRRLKFLLAMPLAATLALLFSFRLVETLPATGPLRQAVERAEVYTATLRELTVTAPAPGHPIFYWGDWQCRLLPDGVGGYRATINLSVDVFYHNIGQSPYLWDGAALHRNLSFHLGPLMINNRVDEELEVFLQNRAMAKAFAAKLVAGDVLVTEGLKLPTGAPVRLEIHLADAKGNSEPTARAAGFVWGEKIWSSGLARTYISASDFWDLIESSPLFTRRPAAEFPERCILRIVSADGLESRKISFGGFPEHAGESAELIKQVRNQQDLIRPGAQVQFEATVGENNSIWLADFIIEGAATSEPAATPAVVDPTGGLSFALFPNPGPPQQAIIHSPRAMQGQLEYYSTDGRLLNRMPVDLQEGENAIALPTVGQLPPGAYFAALLSPAGQTRVQFIIQ